MLKKVTLLLVLFIGQKSLANNIQLSNITLTGQNTTSDFTMVQFNLSWDNSWRISSGPSNWDAAWVFVKFRMGASNPTFTGVSSSGTAVTVTSTANLRAGMPLIKTAGTGTFAANTVIVSITNATQFVISIAPTLALSGASIECIRTWEHAFLNETGHITGTGTAATITSGLNNTADAFNTTTNPSMGAFVHRSGDGAGTFTQTGLQLRWNYGANSIADGQAVDIKVFAVEMVYVPEGSFQVGDGTTTSVQGQFRNGSTNTPLTIGSEDARTLGGAANGYLANNDASGMWTVDDFNNATTKTLPAAFPKGFNAFYCMKYEISQQLWINFFNVLDNTQKTNRDITAGTFNSTGKASDAIVDRNNISWTSGDATLNGGTFGNVACNFLSWMDGAAFADWASLRPMTELEFEKACRGTLTPVENEFAWGTTSITGATGISNIGANNEVASNSGANAVFNNNVNVQGPLRVGSFATANSTRALAGASYYGIMELSGNLWERPVSVGHATGRIFTAPIHGNGLLTNDGFCDISAWPGFNTGKVINAMGIGLRGGAWSHPSYLLLASGRNYASDVVEERRTGTGFRAVRSVP